MDRDRRMWLRWTVTAKMESWLDYAVERERMRTAENARYAVRVFFLASTGVGRGGRGVKTPWILKFSIVLLPFFVEKCFLSVSTLVKWNFTTVGPLEKIPLTTAGKSTISPVLEKILPTTNAYARKYINIQLAVRLIPIKQKQEGEINCSRRWRHDMYSRLVTCIHNPSRKSIVFLHLPTLWESTASKNQDALKYSLEGELRSNI